MAMKPVSKKLNEKQKEILARKLGYDGPMNMFEEFVKSDAAMGAKYNSVISKYMARGGMAKKYAKGGVLKMAAGGTPPTNPLSYVEPSTGITKEIDPNRWAKYIGDPKYDIITKGTDGRHVMSILNRLGGIEKAKAAKAKYDKDLFAYNVQNYKDTLAQKEAAYAQNPGFREAARLADEFKSAVDYFAQNEPSSKSTYEAKATQYANERSRFERETAEAQAAKTKAKEEEASRSQAAVDTRKRLQDEAAARRDAEQARAKSERDTAYSTIDTQYNADREALQKQLSDKQITSEQYKAANAQLGATRKTAREAAAANYTAIVGGSNTQFKKDMELASSTYTNIMSGKTAANANITLPKYTPPTTQPATYTPTAMQSAPQTPGFTGTTPTSTAGSPIAAPQVPQVTAQTIQQTPDQLVTGQAAPDTAATIQPTTVGTAATVADVAPKEAATMEAATVTPDVATALESVQPVTGTVSPEAQVQAQTMDPRTTAVSDLQAATGEATMVEAPAPRTVQEGEMIAGPTVDMGRVEETLAQAQPAQGEVTPEMTVQFQLQQLTENFDATNPPPWAAGAIRSVNSVLTQRGLGASSLAGQAVLQAALESALPIAAADAKVYQEMGIQNLANRQQMAVLTAQQRAAFLGQEFDQAFQTRVTNAATISEIANINFTAEQQIALENARLTNTVNLANLSNQQALIMAEAAQIANLETANLSNRQQAAVLNAQAFLQMDMANLANEQQTELFKAQSMVNSLLTDAAAENAARQFNATSINQVNQFYDGLSTQIKQFNAAQINGINQFNVSQVNAVAEFNATAQNARDQFNAEYRRIIDQSNAEWRRNIALADTAAVNRANEINAANALGITTIDYNNTWQTYRDQMEMAWKTGESALDRETQLAMQVLAKQAQIEAAKYQVEAEKAKALGGLTATVLDKSGLLTAGGSAIISGIKNIGGGSVPYQASVADYLGDSTWSFNGEVNGIEQWNDGINNLGYNPMNEEYYLNGELVWSPGMNDYQGYGADPGTSDYGY